MNFILSVRSVDRKDFEARWEQVRLAGGFSAEYAIPSADIVDYHDGITVAEFLIPILSQTGPLLVAILTIWLRRKKASAKIHGHEFRDMSVTEIERLLAVIDKIDQPKKL